MNTFNKQIDILCMEFDRDMSILEDSMVISEYDGSYFTEASNGNKENFFKKAIRKVKEFIQNIISKLEEKFSKNKLAQKQKAFEIECQKDPSKRNKKVKVRVNDKVYTLSKKAMNDLMKCKTKEEAEKYMEDYRKKREKIVAASVVTITAGSLFAFLGTKLSKTTKQLNSLQQEHEECIKRMEKQDKSNDNLIKINANLIKHTDDLTNTYKKSENDLKSKNKSLENENSRLKSDKYKMKLTVNMLAKQAEHAMKIASRENDSEAYNQYIRMADGDMDRALENIKREKSTLLVTYLHDIMCTASEFMAKY